jgi:hypothetical protein
MPPHIELTGLPRLLEALQSNDWASNDFPDDAAESDGLDFNLDGEGALGGVGFGAEAAELEMEMFGMKRAIYGLEEEEEEGRDEDGFEDSKGRDERKKMNKEDEDEEEEDEVEKLEALMLRMQAVRGKHLMSIMWMNSLLT